MISKDWETVPSEDWDKKLGYLVHKGYLERFDRAQCFKQ